MNWIFIGLLAGSLVTSGHDTREACEGRAVIAKEKGVERGKCVELSQSYALGSGSTLFSCNNGICSYSK